MTNRDARLDELVRTAFPRSSARTPSQDLWPALVARMNERRDRSWFDVGLAACVVAVLAVFPRWLFLLAYHL